jgi:autotransporter-associated beta strand protein
MPVLRSCLFLLSGVFAAPIWGQATIDYADGTVDVANYSTDTPNDPLTLSVVAGAAEQNGVISGTGRVIKVGDGSLTLSGDNTYTGGTTLQEGTLRLSSWNGDALGTGPLLVMGGTLGNAAAGETTFVMNNVMAAADFCIDAQAADGAVEIFGDVDLGTGIRTITLTSEGLACFGGAISGENLTFVTTSGTSQAMFCDVASNTFTGTLRVGTGISLELWKIASEADPQPVAISGDLLIDAGASVILLIEDQFGPTCQVEVNGTLVDESAGINTIQTLSGTGIVVSDVGSTLAVTSGSFAGSITGRQAIVKTGPGTLALSGSNSHTGGTEVVGGVLEAQTDRALGEGDVRIRDGGTLRVVAGVALDVGDGNVILLENDGLSSYWKDFASGEDYDRFGAITSSGSNATEARLLSGSASAETAVEATFAEKPSSPATNDVFRLGDVLSLDGLEGDPFVLQLSYTQEAYEAAALAGLYTSENELVIGVLASSHWLSLGTGAFVEGAWNASYTTLGTHGVDAASNVVWVVTNHHGEFAVVPEPGAASLFGLAGLAALLRRRPSVR